MLNKIIIIGATSGIGRKMAEIYCERGYKVGVTGRREHLLKELKEKFPEHIETECFDVTKNENISRIKSLIHKLGGLDMLVISAGWGQPAEELLWDIDEKVLKTNVTGFIEMANWTFNYFVQQNSGHLATISSIAANRGSGWAPAYAASKSFQSVYFEGLAIKARRLRKNIHVTCIEPGFVNTKMAHGGNKMFWVVPADKAARQIVRSLSRKKRKVYISRRWWIIAKLMRLIPFFIYKRLGA
jgi:short-subunit dehydrogenase